MIDLYRIIFLNIAFGLKLHYYRVFSSPYWLSRPYGIVGPATKEKLDSPSVVRANSGQWHSLENRYDIFTILMSQVKKDMYMYIKVVIRKTIELVLKIQMEHLVMEEF